MAPRTADMQGDPFGALLRQRTIFMGGEVEDFSADALVSQLLLLDSQDQRKDIKLFINSPGEACVAGTGRPPPRSPKASRHARHARRWLCLSGHGHL